MAGVSVQDLGDKRFRVRWREWTEVDGQRKRMDCGRVVHSREAAIELQGKVLRALETVGFYQEEVRPAELVGNFEAAGAAWLRHKAARGCAAATLRRYGSALERFFQGVRAHRKMSADTIVRTDVLSRELFADLQIAWQREGLSESTLYGTTRIALDVWTWAADEPDTYPGLPTPPRDASRVLPRPPAYAAPVPPTLEEADACLRHLAKNAYIARPAGIVMRYTGLRVSQALGIEVGDVNIARAELRVRTGKTRREKAEQRTIPISRHMVDEIAPWIADRTADEKLVKRRKDQRAPANMNHLPGQPLAHGWEAAWKAGEARREVWEPPNREIARPEHAFRAAFQAFLEGQGVRDSVIDYLVGHSPSSVRGRHYAPPTTEQLRAAVDLIPPINWRQPEAEANNVVVLRPR